MSPDKAIPSSHVLILATPGHTPPNAIPLVGLTVLNHQLIVTIDTCRAVVHADGGASVEALNTFVATWECPFAHSPGGDGAGFFDGTGRASPINADDLNFSPWVNNELDFAGRRDLHQAICLAVAEARRTQHTNSHWLRLDGLLATPTPNPGMPHVDRTTRRK